MNDLAKAITDFKVHEVKMRNNDLLIQVAPVKLVAAAVKYYLLHPFSCINVTHLRLQLGV